MSNEEIRELAKKAGFNWGFIKSEGLMDGMIDFAKLVAQHEREACVSIVDEAIDFWVKGGYPEGAEVREAMNIAEAIQARGQA